MSTMVRSSRQKNQQVNVGLDHTLDQLDLTNTKHSIEQQQNTHNSQAEIEHFTE